MSLAISIKLKKEGLTVSNQHKFTAQDVSSIPIYTVGRIPSLLASTVEKAVHLPLENYHLKLESIQSVAVLLHEYSGVSFLTPLSDRIQLNHPDPLFQTDDLVASLLDDRTVLTFPK